MDLRATLVPSKLSRTGLRARPSEAAMLAIVVRSER